MSEWYLEDDSQRSFSEMFTEALEESNLSMLKFSREVGIPYTTIRAYAYGRISPMGKRKKEIAIALGKPEDYFLCCKPKKRVVKKDQQKRMGDEKCKWWDRMLL